MIITNPDKERVFKDNGGLRIEEFEFIQGEHKNILYLGKCEECGDAAIMPKKYLNKYEVRCSECTVVREEDYSVFELFMLHFQKTIEKIKYAGSGDNKDE